MATYNRLWREVRAFAMTLVVFLIVIGAIFLYSGLWPPFVVVESGSMQHSDDTSRFGWMDTGDLILVKEHSSGDEIVTYVEGYSDGHRTFGDYGDVVIYQRDGTDAQTPVIHRAIVLLVYNSTGNSFDVPSLADFPAERWSINSIQGAPWWDLDGELLIYDVGYKGETLAIPLSDLADYGHSGLITKGDHNTQIDQNSNSPISDGPVRDEWVIGVARGELPWFGLMKLWFSGQYQPYGEGTPANSWTNMFVSMVLIIAAPIVVDVSNNLLKRRGIDVAARIRSKMPWRKRKKNDGKG